MELSITNYKADSPQAQPAENVALPTILTEFLLYNTLPFATPQQQAKRSFLDLPTEIVFCILELVFPDNAFRSKATEGRSCRTFVDPVNDRPPFFSCFYGSNRQLAVSLLLTSKQVHDVVEPWLYAQRRFEFLSLPSIRKTYERLGPDKFGLLKRVEICNGWGTSDRSNSIEQLRKVVKLLVGVQSLGLLWFRKGRKDTRYGRPGLFDHDNWTGEQLRVMGKIMRSNHKLTKAYYRSKYTQMRFCSNKTAKMSFEDEVNVAEERVARRIRKRAEIAEASNQNRDNN